jgi:hypothetical protein
MPDLTEKYFFGYPFNIREAMIVDTVLKSEKQQVKKSQ